MFALAPGRGGYRREHGPGYPSRPLTSRPHSADAIGTASTSSPAIRVARPCRLSFERAKPEPTPSSRRNRCRTVVLDPLDLDLGKPGFRQHLPGLLLAPHRAQALASLRQRDGHAVHRRDRVHIGPRACRGCRRGRWLRRCPPSGRRHRVAVPQQYRAPVPAGPGRGSRRRP